VNKIFAGILTSRFVEMEKQSDGIVGVYEKSYAVKKFAKLAIPSFPDPHTYQEQIRQPWERKLEELSSEIRLKPNWTEKIYDEELLAKWESELTQYPWMWKRFKTRTAIFGFSQRT